MWTISGSDLGQISQIIWTPPLYFHPYGSMVNIECLVCLAFAANVANRNQTILYFEIEALGSFLALEEHIVDIGT